MRFSVTNPEAGNAAWDIQADAPFTGSSSAISINLAWPALEISNLGSGSGTPTGPPAQPVRINALTAATANGDGSYTARATVAVPGTVSGSGIASLEGRTAVDVNGEGGAERIPVTGGLGILRHHRSGAGATPAHRRSGRLQRLPPGAERARR